MSDSTDGGAPAGDGGERVYVATIVRGADGRFREVDILPDPDPVGGSREDWVMTFDAETRRPRWQLPSEAGFSAVPMILDVPLTDGDGFLLTDGDGAVLTGNVPYI